MNERDAGWTREWCRGYKLIWEIGGMTCLLWLERHRIGAITHRIKTHTCRIRDGKLTCARNFLKSQFLMTISPISSHLSLSHPQPNHYLETQSKVIPLGLSVPWSRVNTEYSIHWVLHSPCTASSQDQLASRSQRVSYLSISQQTMLYSILYIPTNTD